MAVPQPDDRQHLGATSATLTYRDEHGEIETVVVSEELARALLQQQRSTTDGDSLDEKP